MDRIDTEIVKAIATSPCKSLDFKEIHVIIKMNFSDDTLYQALLVFILVTHLCVPQIRKSYSVSDSFFFLTKQNKKILDATNIQNNSEYYQYSHVNR
mgnify:CR=1 FL=1